MTDVIELKTMDSNDDINNIQGLIDLITDQYGNYYYATQIKTNAGKLEEITLGHAYYEDSFSILSYAEPLHNELEDKYRNKHVSHRLKDRLIASLDRAQRSNRKIFTIQELIANGTTVYTKKLTETHIRAEQF
ncbi:hypothetical protein [Bacillus cereus]|uniref:hypothetical protein n=1 Tax=Bacillus cereus TaxID=1396 RepID=UPI000995005F|nr:hypothetical protein [Bacillus cereus]OOZ91566.1 hypothetical protein BHL25_01045 [Bacillus cereus]